MDGLVVLSIPGVSRPKHINNVPLQQDQVLMSLLFMRLEIKSRYHCPRRHQDGHLWHDLEVSLLEKHQRCSLNGLTKQSPQSHPNIMRQKLLREQSRAFRNLPNINSGTQFRRRIAEK
mmetsp:Transcript_65728/g.189502  ORF Transcript_65728/g.189502 Transcript_65728/m.189502 type:complete len:118 (+) Transcript_65728:1064-1417(+)